MLGHGTKFGRKKEAAIVALLSEFDLRVPPARCYQSSPSLAEKLFLFFYLKKAWSHYKEVSTAGAGPRHRTRNTDR
jgi:hypothetical protein